MSNTHQEFIGGTGVPDPLWTWIWLVSVCSRFEVWKSPLGQSTCGMSLSQAEQKNMEREDAEMSRVSVWTTGHQWNIQMFPSGYLEAGSRSLWRTRDQQLHACHQDGAVLASRLIRLEENNRSSAAIGFGRTGGWRSSWDRLPGPNGSRSR